MVQCISSTPCNQENKINEYSNNQIMLIYNLIEPYNVLTSQQCQEILFADNCTDRWCKLAVASQETLWVIALFLLLDSMSRMNTVKLEIKMHNN